MPLTDADRDFLLRLRALEQGDAPDVIAALLAEAKRLRAIAESSDGPTWPGPWSAEPPTAQPK